MCKFLFDSLYGILQTILQEDFLLLRVGAEPFTHLKDTVVPLELDFEDHRNLMRFQIFESESSGCLRTPRCTRVAQQVNFTVGFVSLKLLFAQLDASVESLHLWSGILPCVIVLVSGAYDVAKSGSKGAVVLDLWGIFVATGHI